ncbi:MAG: hypothetical protein FJ405_14275 [Verrucomicrobia bacterium]|nr:hypothetical protein [Verrucomicrobiota bacterium]
MRVTASTFPISMAGRLNKLNISQTRLHQQAPTGQRIQTPEDGPSSMNRIPDMQQDAKALGQCQRNVLFMKDQASASYSAMQSLKKFVDRESELSMRTGGLRRQEELNIYWHPQSLPTDRPS